VHYFAQIFYLVRGRLELQGSFLCSSRLEHDADAWLDEQGLPRLYKWKLGAQTGSNAPGRRGVLNTAQYDLPGDSTKLLAIDVYELKPIDPFKADLLPR
jgi:hypothetical protein